MVFLPNESFLNIDEDKLKVEIELRLRESKIIVKSNNEPQPFSPSTLIVEVRALPISNNYYIGEVFVNLYEAISIRRNPKQEANGLTWNYRSHLLEFSKAKTNLLTNEIFFGVDNFINDYLKANGGKMP